MPSLSRDELAAYSAVQKIARDVLDEIAAFIRVGIIESQIVQKCVELLNDQGVISSWYHGCMALVLVGRRTVLSVSGAEYQPSEAAVQADDMVTVDLSPELDGYWGDCARSFVVQCGAVVGKSAADPELSAGMSAEDALHRKLMEIATPETTFCELFASLNAEIKAMEFENLDFLGNLGHTIEKHVDRRRYIDRNCSLKIADAPLFTFEPHIRRKHGRWGFKHEEIYRLDGSRLRML